MAATEISIEWVVSTYRTGRTKASIATELGVSVAAVSKWLSAAGVTSRSTAETAAQSRPSELNDAIWLADRYSTASAGEIASELGVNHQRVLAALRRLRIEVRSRHDPPPGRQSLLHDRAALSAAVRSASVAEIAVSVGRSRAGVSRALQREGVVSPHRYNGQKRMPRPADEVLVGLWDAHGTVKHVARACGVSPTTARVWLAEADCFVNDVAVLLLADLEAAIAAGESLKMIARRFALTDSTVLVELHRHGLFARHRRRHLLDRE